MESTAEQVILSGKEYNKMEDRLREYKEWFDGIHEDGKVFVVTKEDGFYNRHIHENRVKVECVETDEAKEIMQKDVIDKNAKRLERAEEENERLYEKNEALHFALMGVRNFIEDSGLFGRVNKYILSDKVGEFIRKQIKTIEEKNKGEK